MKIIQLTIIQIINLTVISKKNINFRIVFDTKKCLTTTNVKPITMVKGCTLWGKTVYK